MPLPRLIHRSALEFMGLILASTSPRRREILALLGVPFEVIAPEFDETLANHRPLEQEVLEFAVAKAQSVGRHRPDAITIGSDTMILLNGRKIGKPRDVAQAKEILRSLSAETHRIYTSIAVIDGLGGPGLEAVEEVLVTMRSYSDAEIERYLALGESLDKAGAYSIQGEGRALIESIHGDYLAAVGLPLKPIADYLRSRDIEFALDIDKLYSEKSFLNWRSF
jgi:septum formation protein